VRTGTPRHSKPFYQSKNKLDVTGTIESMTAESLDVVIIFLPE
jgi:hypothetical protein